MSMMRHSRRTMRKGAWGGSPAAGRSRGVVSFEYILLIAALIFVIVMGMPVMRDWVLSFGELIAYFSESPVLVNG